MGKTAKHKFDVEVELAERAAQFVEVPGNVEVDPGDDHVITALVSGVPTPNIYITDRRGNRLSEGEVVVVDEETVRYSLTLTDIQVVRLSATFNFCFLLRGPGGSSSGRSWKSILWCFLKEESDTYQLLFTSSKNIDPSQSYGQLKVSAYV